MASGIVDFLGDSLKQLPHQAYARPRKRFHRRRLQRRRPAATATVIVAVVVVDIVVVVVIVVVVRSNFAQGYLRRAPPLRRWGLGLPSAKGPCTVSPSPGLGSWGDQPLGHCLRFALVAFLFLSSRRRVVVDLLAVLLSSRASSSVRATRTLCAWSACVPGRLLWDG
jgi:hypothetical protein